MGINDFQTQGHTLFETYFKIMFKTTELLISTPRYKGCHYHCS